MQVRMDRLELIKKCETRRAKIISDHKLDKEKYQAALKKARSQLAGACRKTASTLDKQQLPLRTSWWRGKGEARLEIKVSFPMSEPTEPHLGEIDRQLKFLRASDVKTVVIRPNSEFEWALDAQ